MYELTIEDIKNNSKFSPKEKILLVAMDMFAQKGFAVVTMRQIADALGIWQGGIYNHFKSKQEILDAVFQLFPKADSVLKSLPDEDEMGKIQTCNELNMFLKELFLIWRLSIDNLFFRKLTNIVIVEQLRNERMKQYLRDFIINLAAEYLTKLCEIVQKKGIIKQYDPQLIAETISSRMKSMFLENLVEDRLFDTDHSEKEFFKFIDHFCDIYKT